ncbi:g3691 [Coccomyxa viridis]|uniref:G3691 protein n=1 Tax=Coccomyxa viridis TaxID=1274662 RepID=A0ABP1FSE2_9CHLO
MGKKKQQYDGGHYSRRGYSKEDLCKGPEPQGYAGLDRHALYESAVQSPKGDISYLLCFYQRYIGQQVPEHLREDFCGTALLASTWCRGDLARRTGMGLDIDRDALMWGMQHNGEGLADTAQPCLWLLHGDVTQPLDKAVLVNCPVRSNSNGSQPSVEQSMQDMSIHASDIICAFNFSVCLLHQRSEVQAYFRQSRQALSKRGGILVMDLLGGHAAEESVFMHRHNDTTGARFVWEQEGYNPVTRHIHCYITLRDPDTQKNLRRAFHYHWRLWTIPELHDMLMGAGFSRVNVWLRPMQGVSSGCEDEEGEEGSSDSGEHDEDFEEYSAKTFSPKTAELLSKGWTAFVIGVAEPQ